MDIQIKHIGIDGLLVTAHGRLDLDNAVEYGTTVKETIEDSSEGVKSLTLDFMYITFLSSFGLKVILELYKFMQERGTFKLINVPAHIQESLRMVGFDKFIEINNV